LVQVYKPSTQVAKAGGEWVWSQLQLYRETLSLNKWMNESIN
jgi:hypothetical protein